MNCFATAGTYIQRSSGHPYHDISVFEGTKEEKGGCLGRMIIGATRLLAAVALPNTYDIKFLPPDIEVEKLKEAFAKIFSPEVKIVKPNTYGYAGTKLFDMTVTREDAKKVLEAIANISDGVFGQTKDTWHNRAIYFVEGDHTLVNQADIFAPSPCTIC